jgi:hypothetical protein
LKSKGFKLNKLRFYYKYETILVKKTAPIIVENCAADRVALGRGGVV